MMVGREVPAAIHRAERASGPEVLVVKGLTRRDEAGIERLRDVTLSLRAGEILAIAGVDGNGQADLVDVIAGLKAPDHGFIMLNGRDITRASVRARLAAGISYIPVDRAGTSLVPGMSVEDNLALREFDRQPLSRNGLLNSTAFRSFAMSRMAHFGISAAGPGAPARTLSGGNQQKIVLAREIGRNPQVLVAYQPTWGLDFGATRFVIDQVLALRETGGAVLYISAELEEVLTVGDRIAVICSGRLSQAVRREQVDVTEIGLMMAGAVQTWRASETVPA
jgi:simple sugar transport system ATP-binding protein